MNKTHEQFINDFLEKNPKTNITIIGRYIKRNIKIKCQCNVCNNTWDASPGNLLAGHGCPQCSKKAYTLTLEKFNERLHQKFPYIEIISDFTKGTDSAQFKCNNCGNIWILNNAISIFNTKLGCPSCAIALNKRTHEEFLKIIEDKSPNIQILSQYQAPNKKIKCRCKACNYEWTTDSRDLIKGTNCIKCSIKKRTKTHTQFLSELNNINKNIELLSDYQTSNIKVKCLCKICNYEWYALPSKLLMGRGCPKCAHKFVTDEEFKQRVYEINNDIVILDTYTNRDTKVLCKCKKNTAHMWYASPGNLLNGTGCPICTESKAEKRIRNFLIKNNIKFEQEYCFNDCRDKKALPFDFYLSEYNLCIEYDGKQHYEIVPFTNDLLKAKNNFETTKLHDKIKDEYCSNNNIHLLRIPYTEYKNIDDILYNELFNKGGDD